MSDGWLDMYEASFEANEGLIIQPKKIMQPISNDGMLYNLIVVLFLFIIRINLF